MADGAALLMANPVTNASLCRGQQISPTSRRSGFGENPAYGIARVTTTLRCLDRGVEPVEMIRVIEREPE